MRDIIYGGPKTWVLVAAWIGSSALLYWLRSEPKVTRAQRWGYVVLFFGSFLVDAALLYRLVTHAR